MYAIIENGGKQYKVFENDVLRLRKIKTKAGSLVEDSKVLLISDGKETKIGTPVVECAKVILKITDHGKSEKIIVYKMKPKKGYRRKQGHRQHYTEVIVEKIQS